MAKDPRWKREEWRPAFGYEGLYEVSSHGRVRKIVREWPAGKKPGPGDVRMMKSHPHGRSGFSCVKLTRNRVGRKVEVHALVCHAFHGPAPSDRHEVIHLDGNNANNKVANLAWATRAEKRSGRKGLRGPETLYPLPVRVEQERRGDG